MLKTKDNDVRINKLHGKYINDKISPEELKELISKSMTGNVSMKEFGNKFRNHQATKPAEVKQNVRGEIL
jgi:hypothetical protein